MKKYRLVKPMNSIMYADVKVGTIATKNILKTYSYGKMYELIPSYLVENNFNWVLLPKQNENIDKFNNWMKYITDEINSTFLIKK